jgi:hypothetical protein
MRDLGDLWRRCQSGEIRMGDIEGEWKYEKKIVVGDTEYFDNSISDFSLEKPLTASGYSIGNAISKRFDVTLLSQSVSGGERVSVFVRINANINGVTEWFKFGNYSVFEHNIIRGKTKITCFDDVRKLDVRFSVLVEMYDIPSHQVPSIVYLEAICKYLAVEIDPRSIVNTEFIAFTPWNMTAREVLGHIASQNSANATLTDENKLMFVRPINKTPSFEISAIRSLSTSGSVKCGRVIVHFGHGISFSRGDREARAFEFFNPWASSVVREEIHAVISEYTYNSGAFNNVTFDPALELGDTVEIRGVNYELWSVKLNGRMFADVVIPDVDDLVNAGDLDLTQLSMANFEPLILDSFPNEIEYEELPYGLYAVKDSSVSIVHEGNRPITGWYVKEAVTRSTWDTTTANDFLYEVIDNTHVHIIRYLSARTKPRPRLPATIENLPIRGVYATAFNYDSITAVNFADTEIEFID